MDFTDYPNLSPLEYAKMSGHHNASSAPINKCFNNANHTFHSPIQVTMAGYRVISKKYRWVARVDRGDWVEGTTSADHYRRVFSEDKMVVPEAWISQIPNSSGSVHRDDMSFVHYIPMPWDKQPGGANIVSSVTIVREEQHDKLRIFNRGALAGTLTVVAGDGDQIRNCLLAHFGQTSADYEEISNGNDID